MLIVPSAPGHASVSPTQNRSSTPAKESRPIRVRSSCPVELEPLTVALLRDLPDYINRSYVRLVKQRFPSSGWNYAIVASQPEFTPLPIDSEEYKNPPDQNLHQIFFTVLERQYSGKQVIEWQNFHWLFLSQTEAGWQVVLLFSRRGSYPIDNQQPLSPPRESTNGLTAQAIRNWLRDCQAGAVKL